MKNRNGILVDVQGKRDVEINTQKVQKSFVICCVFQIGVRIFLVWEKYLKNIIHLVFQTTFELYLIHQGVSCLV